MSSFDAFSFRFRSLHFPYFFHLHPPVRMESLGATETVCARNLFMIMHLHFSNDLFSKLIPLLFALQKLYELILICTLNRSMGIFAVRTFTG